MAQPGCCQAARGAQVWVSNCAALWLRGLPQPPITICAMDPHWGRVPLGQRSRVDREGTLQGTLQAGYHPQPAVPKQLSTLPASGGHGEEAFPWGQFHPVPGCWLLAAARAAKPSRQLSVLGQRWAGLALGSWSTAAADD